MAYNKVPYSPNYPPNQEHHQPPMPMPSAPIGFEPQYHAQPSAGYPAVPPPYPMPMPTHVSPAVPHMVQPGHPTPPMQHQTLPSGWMNMPLGSNDCPSGLEYLSTIDKLIIHQKVELTEILFDFESNNKYQIKNSLGQNVYLAAEETDCCSRLFCGPYRPFNIYVMDAFGSKILHFRRRLTCASVLPCIPDTLEVLSAQGQVLGTVVQRWTFFRPCFAVKDERDTTWLNIRGPLCRTCGQVKFKIYSKDGKKKVGTISKNWSGAARELFTDSDKFGVSFPSDLDVKLKAVLLGAVFLIDFLYFEK